MMYHHDNRPYQQAASDAARTMRDKLATRIAVGRRTGAAAIQRILTEVPNDRIVSGAAVTFASDDTGLKVHYGRVIETVHPHALGQMAESARMPRTFLGYLQEQGAWGQGLAARTLNELFAHDPDRHLIRSVGGQTRSMLSTKYRRLHPGMLMEAFQTACTQVGAVAYEAVCTDTRWVVKAVLQEVVEPVRDEVLALGVVIHESPHGAGATEISPFIERMWCTNKAVCSSELRRVHLGSRLDAVGVEWSDETVLADTRVMCLQIQDLVRGQLDANAIRKLEAAVRSAHEQQIDHTKFEAFLRKNLSRDEADRVVGKFASADIELLPMGNTAWRASNALSWFAGEVTDPERAFEIQKLAGAMLPRAA
nr:hypothetical protein [Deltaproteobacteria bacterium]